MLRKGTAKAVATALLSAGLLTGLRCSAGVLINEVNYDPTNATELLEFVELFNTGDTAVDLGGWYFSDGVSFTFPTGTLINATSYVVVAESPANLTARYGVPARWARTKGIWRLTERSSPSGIAAATRWTRSPTMSDSRGRWPAQATAVRWS